MFQKVYSLYLQGMKGIRISVEADVSDGLPGFNLVGFLSGEVREAQDRVRTAIRNIGFVLPPKRVTVNLSPADIKKEGTVFDLAIAVAILAAHGIIDTGGLNDTAFLGELGLDGSVRGIPGVLALSSSAVENGITRLVLPRENMREAAMIKGVRVIGANDLNEVVHILKNGIENAETCEDMSKFEVTDLNVYDVDFSEVNGQPMLRRAVEVAAAGMHNLLMIGPAGSGKTMVAKRIPTIMPKLEFSECIEISKIYSICHMLSEDEPLIKKRPFRAPHYTISAQALTGGGIKPKPGEISLATGGILFLDELAEMNSATLETLRQPLEERQVTISRVMGTVTYPANFQLVAALNPCRCGYYPEARCKCTPNERRRYLSKISRPLLDRIDICVEADAVTYSDVTGSNDNEPSSAIRKRVEAARDIQRDRFKDCEGIFCNGQMQGAQIRNSCVLGSEENSFMAEAFEELKLSARMYEKILKVARTIADLDNSESIRVRHLSEAILYGRVKERYWGV